MVLNVSSAVISVPVFGYSYKFLLLCNNDIETNLLFCTRYFEISSVLSISCNCILNFSAVGIV